jgi:ribosomal protein S17
MSSSQQNGKTVVVAVERTVKHRCTKAYQAPTKFAAHDEKQLPIGTR